MYNRGLKIERWGLEPWFTISGFTIASHFSWNGFSAIHSSATWCPRLCSISPLPPNDHCNPAFQAGLGGDIGKSGSGICSSALKHLVWSTLAISTSEPVHHTFRGLAPDPGPKHCLIRLPPPEGGLSTGGWVSEPVKTEYCAIIYKSTLNSNLFKSQVKKETARNENVLYILLHFFHVLYKGIVE